MVIRLFVHTCYLPESVGFILFCLDFILRKILTTWQYDVAWQLSLLLMTSSTPILESKAALRSLAKLFTILLVVA